MHSSLMRQCAALLIAAVTLPAAATTTTPLLETRASLAQPGWIPPSQRPFPTTSWSHPLWNGAIRSQWVHQPGTTEEILMGAGYARAHQSGNGTLDASVAIGVSAQARAVATAAGSGTASAQAAWWIEVVINPFANVAQFGLPMYMRLLERFGCDNQGVPQGVVVCQPVDLSTRIGHVSTGRFAHSAQPFHEGEATFRETVTVSDSQIAPADGGSATFSGSATYDVLPSPNGGRNLVGAVTASGGWTADDFSPFGATPAYALSLYPAGDYRNNETDRNGDLAGESLFAIREADVLGRFEFGVPFPELNVPYALPSAAYIVTIDQLATAGFGTAGYGWGTVAADFDNTARTSILAVLDPTGTLDLDPSIIQVFITPVPEPSAFCLSAGGLAVVAFVLRRRHQVRTTRA
jgi:hypothetical protein